MSIAADPVSVVPVAAQAVASTTNTKPSRRTTTAKADMVAQPEPR